MSIVASATSAIQTYGESFVDAKIYLAAIVRLSDDKKD
ncbi:hypothetical protein SF123566_3471 [Shigella flexneri 1235-66]|nr:hypothetical protein SF123566_3471 [Shigella flexneri 1235-66]